MTEASIRARVMICRAPADGLIAATLLAFLASAGFFYVNIMAAIVSGLVSDLHFTAQQAGRVGACNVYGAAAGAFCAVFLVHRLPWRRSAALLLCGLIGIDLVSIAVHGVGLLTALRLLHGLMGGLLVGISFAVIGRTRAPDRSFGMLLVVQSSLGGLGLMFLPRLVPLFGAPVLFIALAAFSAVALSMLAFLPEYPPRSTPTAGEIVAGPIGMPRAFVVALFAVFLFQAGNMALAAYMIELGRSVGLGLGFMTTTLGIAGWIAAVGSLLVVALGTRWGRAWPIAIGMALTWLGTTAFYFSGQAWIYAAANLATAITWMFVIPYLLGLCAAFDLNGRAATLAGLFSKLGLASGPFVASLLVTGDQYGSVVSLSVTALALSALCGVSAARLVDIRTQRDGSAPI